MKLIKLIVIFVVVMAATFAMLVTSKKTQKDGTTTTQNTPGNVWETKTDNQGPVTIAVTPINVSGKAPVWEFSVAMDTHSVELDEDLAESSFLLDGQGVDYGPIYWEGSSPGGHHREGKLKFKQVSPFPDTLRIEIRDVGGVPLRSFQWKGGEFK